MSRDYLGFTTGGCCRPWLSVWAQLLLLHIQTQITEQQVTPLSLLTPQLSKYRNLLGQNMTATESQASQVSPNLLEVATSSSALFVLIDLGVSTSVHFNHTCLVCPWLPG